MAAKPKIMTSSASTDQWSVKEKLCLASSVMRSGDQNWVSVSRAVKPFAEPGHQPEFFSQRNCARQYSAMLENVETPKRKRSSERGEVVETPGDVIVKKITLERIDELKAQIREDKARFKQLKKEIDEIRSGALDDKLQDMLTEILSKKQAAEEEAEPSKSSTETGKSAKPLATPTPGKSRRTSKPSRTSECSGASDIDVTGKPEDDGDSVFDPSASSDGLTDKHKVELQTQESNDSTGGAESSDVDVTAVSDAKSSSATSTLSKLLTQKAKNPSSSSISPIDPPSSSPSLSSSKASAAKEAAKILLSGSAAGGSSASEKATQFATLENQSTNEATCKDKVTDKKTDKKAIEKKAATDKKATDKKDESKGGSEDSSAKATAATATTSSSSASVNKQAEASNEEKQSKVAPLKANDVEMKKKSDVCPFMDEDESTSINEQDLQASLQPNEYAPERFRRRTRSRSRSGDVGQVPCSSPGREMHPETSKATPNRQQRRSRSYSTDDTEEVTSPTSARRIQRQTRLSSSEDVTSPKSSKTIQVTKERRQSSKDETKEDDTNKKDGVDKKDDITSRLEKQSKITSPVRDARQMKSPKVKNGAALQAQTETPSPKYSSKKDDDTTDEEVEHSRGKMIKKSGKKRGRPAKLTTPSRSMTQDIPKIDIDAADIKSVDVAEDSDSNLPTEPPSPSRPEPSETRGKKKSRGRPPSSARRSGRTRARLQAEGEDTSEERNRSRRPSDSLPDDEARSETAESEETERPSAESDRDDASSVAAGSLHQSMFADSLPGSPSSVTTEHEQDHTYRLWRKAIMLVWRTIAAHKYANIFLHPVTDDIAPGYCSIVHRRTDLTKIKKSIENGTIRTTEQFHRDMLLMFQNAIMYNNRDHDVYQMACAMQNDAVVYIEEFISTQLMVQQPDSVKMLRSKDGGSRRIETPGKDDLDRQRRGSSEIETSGKKRRTRADEG